VVKIINNHVSNSTSVTRDSLDGICLMPQM